MPGIIGAFALSDRSAYGRWRDAKLESSPKNVGDLVVEVGNIAALTAAEHAALLERIRRSNMAVYVEPPKSVRDLGIRLDDLSDHNILAASFLPVIFLFCLLPPFSSPYF